MTGGSRSTYRECSKCVLCFVTCHTRNTRLLRGYGPVTLLFLPVSGRKTDGSGTPVRCRPPGQPGEQASQAFFVPKREKEADSWKCCHWKKSRYIFGKNCNFTWIMSGFAPNVLDRGTMQMGKATSELCTAAMTS